MTHDPKPTAILKGDTGRTKGEYMSQAQISLRRQSAPVSGARTQRGAISPFGPIRGGSHAGPEDRARTAMVQAYEVGLMASAAASAPLQLIGGVFDPACDVLPPVRTTCPRRDRCCWCTASAARNQAGPCSREP